MNQEGIYHKIIIKNSEFVGVESYIDKYNNELDLIKKLSITYDFIDKMFDENTEKGLSILKILLSSFNDINLHLSEIKTLLVISKPYKDNPKLKVIRENLLETYTKLK